MRYLKNVLSYTFVTYFGYHRPIMTEIPLEVAWNITITAVTNRDGLFLIQSR